MKNIIIAAVLTFLVSCSTSLVDIEKSKVDYIRSGIVCDSKTTKFEILNKDELAEFLDDGGIGEISVKYQYEKAKGVKLNGVVRVAKISIDGHRRHYKMKYKRYAFPMSECRKLKTDVKVFK